MNPFAYLSDANLDNAYAACWDLRDFATAAMYGTEIINRLTTVGSFVSGLFGYNRFPKYTERSGFAQDTAAKESVADSAKNVVTGLVDTVSATVKNIGFGAGAVMAVAGIVGAIYLIRKK